jgi:hypothetical protein
MAWKYEIALRLLSKQPRMKRADRPRCGGRTRKDRPCRAPLIDRLVNLGWLAGVARNDKAAVLAAFQRFVQEAAAAERMRRSRERRQAGSFCYVVELPGP